MAVGAPIDDVDAAMCGMPEHQNRRSSQVEFGHRVADRKLFQGRGRFGDDDGGKGVDVRPVRLLRRRDDLACRIDGGPVRRARLVAFGAMTFQPPMIAA